METLYSTLLQVQWQQVVMWFIGGLLIWLAIKKEGQSFFSWDCHHVMY